MDENTIAHYRSIMTYLDVRPLAKELGLSVYATRVLHIIAVHTYENSPVSVTKIAKLWRLEADEVRDAVSEFTIWNGYVQQGKGGKLYANLDVLTSIPLWHSYWSALLGDTSAFSQHAVQLARWDYEYRVV